MIRSRDMISRQLIILLANTILAVSILVFAIGFFPHKTVLPGISTWPTEVEGRAERPVAPFDRIIFMVVDALRSDFVYGNQSQFHFTQDLIRRGHAVPFTGHASPPTITMPKVKAITTGSVPSFVDLILNFAESDTSSTLAKQDSWLAQMRALPDGKLVMYGDDTWLRLFPDFFERADGTTSFFVSDFTEVDNNVTRHLPRELGNSDWNTMILHYLGLDHIGHKTGPRGPNMAAKQQEMDGIVQMIYEAMLDHSNKSHHTSTVLVLLGDHGMNDAGNHGASSAGETSTALTFISPKFEHFYSHETRRSWVHDEDNFHYYDEVEQSDIAVTLAALLGFPIPTNSLGVIMPRMLNMWSDRELQIELMLANVRQLWGVVRTNFPQLTSVRNVELCSDRDTDEMEELYCSWSRIVTLSDQLSNMRREYSPDSGGTVGSKPSPMPDIRPAETEEQPESEDEKRLRREIQQLCSPETLEQLQKFAKRAQSLLSSSASKYDETKMVIGIASAATAFALSAFAARSTIVSGGLAGLIVTLILILYGVTMFASSYVEEEHQFWYWATSAWQVVLTVKAMRQRRPSGSTALFGNLSTCILFGFARRWHQTGQKYAGGPDLVTEGPLARPWFLWALVILTYALVARRLSRRAMEWESAQLAISSVVVVLSSFLFKLSFTASDAPELLQGIRPLKTALSYVSQYPLVSLARLVYAGLAHLITSSFYCARPWTNSERKKQFLASVHDIISLMLITQSRTVNIPLFLIFYSQVFLLREHQTMTELELTVSSLLMQYTSFFMFGGTNAISSVDLSNAYNGVDGFNVLVVGILTFVSNWVGPIWWASARACLLTPKVSISSSTTSISARSANFDVLTAFMAGSALSVMVACMVLREHLFIWTVFSPKYLYTMAWTFVQHFVINGFFGSLVLN